MKKSIYLYLQRYLLKVLTKGCPAENYNTASAPHLMDKEPIDLLTLNFLKNYYIKKRVGLNLDFYLLSFIFFINQTCFLKKSQKQDFYFFRFVKNSNLNYTNPIKSTTFTKGANSLYKKNVDRNSDIFPLLNFRKIKKSTKIAYKFIVYHRQVTFFFQKKNKNLFIFIASFKIKPKSFILLKSVLNVLIFLSQQLSINKQSEMVYLNKLCCIAFYFEPVTKGFRLSTNGPFFCDKTLICVDILFFFTFKYVKKKKRIQSITYKNFVYIVNKFNLYWSRKKNITKVKNNFFRSHTVLITTAINSYFFFLRPLFSLTRLDTFYLCESLKLPIYPDQSNFRVDFLRNRVRKQILPAIRVLLNPQFDTLLCKFNEFSS